MGDTDTDDGRGACGECVLRLLVECRDDAEMDELDLEMPPLGEVVSPQITKRGSSLGAALFSISLFRLRRMTLSPETRFSKVGRPRYVWSTSKISVVYLDCNVVSWRSRGGDAGDSGGGDGGGGEGGEEG